MTFFLVIAFVIATAWWLAMRWQLRRFDANQRHAVAAMPAHFPLLVLTSGRTPNVVFGEQLAAFLGQHPDASLWVPPDAVDALNRGLDGRAHVAVHGVARGVESVEFEVTWSDDWRNAAWYDTDGRRVVPRDHIRYFRGATAAAVPCLVALLIAAAAGAVVVIVTNVISKS